MKVIELTQGKHALVDDCDYIELSKHKWRAKKFVGCKKTGSIYFYAIRVKDGKQLFMHRQILNAPIGMVVDHQNKDTLDNRRSNIRVCDYSTNLMNRDIGASNKTGCMGVSFYKGRGKYVAEIKVNGKKISLGSFVNLSDAVEIRKMAEKQYGFHPNHNRSFKVLSGT